MVCQCLLLFSQLFNFALCNISLFSKKKNMRMYLASFILLESFLIGTFSSIDLFSFYIFFESILIPMYLIIGFWGGERRIYSAYKFSYILFWDQF